ALAFVGAPDYEAPEDADDDDRCEVVDAGWDGALQDTQTLSVLVGNVNEAPVITSHGGGDTATLTVMENTVVVGAVVASDPEGTGIGRASCREGGEKSAGAGAAGEKRCREPVD